MLPSDVHIRPYEPEDESGVLDCLDDVFDGWAGAEEADRRGFFRWKHLESPFGPSIMSVAEADGAVVGFQALMPWHLRAGDRVVHALRGADIAVRREMRGRGVAAGLVEATSSRRPAHTALVFSNPNGMSAPLLSKLGRREVGPFRFRVRPRRPGRMLAAVVATGHVEPTPPPAVEAPTAGEVLADDRCSALVASLPSPPKLATARTLEYLRWRYGARPGYWATCTEAGGELTGLAIFRFDARRSLRVQMLCELLPARGDGRAARELLGRALAATEADYAVCRPALSSGAAARRCGFVTVPHPHAILVKPIAAETSPDPGDPRSWALSCGDLDLL